MGNIQGLKPDDLIDLIGTTEVVPFYKTLLGASKLSGLCQAFIILLAVISEAAAHTARIPPMIANDHVTGISIHRTASIFNATNPSSAPRP
jgi:hypothetical protein